MEDQYVMTDVNEKEVKVKGNYSVLYKRGSRVEQWILSISPTRISIDCMTFIRQTMSFESKRPFILNIHRYHTPENYMKEYILNGYQGIYTISVYREDDDEDIEDKERMGSIEFTNDSSVMKYPIPYEIAKLAQMILCGSTREYLEEFVEKSKILHKLC